MKHCLICSLLVIALAGTQVAEAQAPGYVIITTTNIVSASTQLTSFVASKQARGFTVQVVSNTPTGQGGWGGGTGDTAANNIRAWLKGHYTNANAEVVIDYVLLIGNPTSSVPMKACYPRSTNEVCLTDFYYADLTGNWDVNSNGFYGEYDDYTNGGPDRAYEVAVGRVPYYGSASDLDKILAKTVAYENASVSNATWRNKAILHMGDLNIWNTGNAVGDPLIRTPILDPNGWFTKTFYYCTSPDYAEPNVVAEWTNSPYGAVCFFGHGTDAGTELVSSEFLGDVQIFGLASVDVLHDDRPAFCFLAACSLANPNTPTNLSFSLLRNGAVSAVGASSWTFTMVPVSSFGSESGTDPAIERDFMSRLVTEGMDAGNVLYDLKEDNAPSALGNKPNWWMNYLAYNLYGCPAVGIRSVRFVGPVWSF